MSKQQLLNQARRDAAAWDRIPLERQKLALAESERLATLQRQLRESGHYDEEKL